MKTLVGVVVALALAVGIMGWQLRSAWSDAALARQEAIQALQVAGEQRQQAELLLSRLDALDDILKGLAEGARQNAQQLDQTLAAIDGITKTEGDTDESLACLDVRVPRQLDDSLR